MRKSIILILILAALLGGGYYLYSQGLIDKWFPGLLEKVIPGYESPASVNGGRISSDAENAVYVDSVSMIADLGSGNGLIPRFGGTVEPQQTKEFKLENERTVAECYVKEGDEVKDGQKLFTYNTTDEESKLEQTQIDLERLQNTLDTSEAKKAELQKQMEKAKTPAKELEILTAQNEIRQNELDQKSKQKEIDKLREKIKNSTVVSDMDGIVKSVNDSSSGDSDGGNESGAYITLLKTGTYRIKASANEQNINQIFQGESVLVFSRVDSKVTWHGTITQIKTDQGDSEDKNQNSYGYGNDSAGSSNYPFYVELESSDGLMLGQHVYLEQDLGQDQRRSGIWLDDYYIVTEENGSSYVWAASSANKMEKRAVVLGDADPDLEQHEIMSGLSESDYICEPSPELEEGLPVNYNDPNGEGETESMFTWDEGAGISDEWDESEDIDWDETEEYEYYDPELYADGTVDGEGYYNGVYYGDDQGGGETYDDETEVVDEEGFIDVG